jgi:hypothetical protein
MTNFRCENESVSIVLIGPLPGERVFAQVGLPTLTDFHVGAFDDAKLFRPTRHIFPDERLPWLHLADT